MIGSDAYAWQAQAACAGVVGDLFFPGRGAPTEPAKRICRLCPVRLECLDYALAANERVGVWGGMSERERRVEKRRRARRRAA